MPTPTLQHKFAVIRQPPEQWYNQARGRQDTMVIAVKLEGPHHPALYHMDRLPLKLTLLYESYVEVAAQSVLQAMSTPELDCNSREGNVVVRINQVSRSHQKQRFRVKIELGELPESCPNFEVISATTTPVRVLSKLSTRKQRGRAKASPVQPAAIHKRKRPEGTVDLGQISINETRVDFFKMSIDDLRNWCLRAARVMKGLEWRRVGYETVTNQDGDFIIDRTHPVLQCSICGAIHVGVNTPGNPASHEYDCELYSLTKGAASAGTVLDDDRMPHLGRSDAVIRHHRPGDAATPIGVAAAALARAAAARPRDAAGPSPAKRQRLSPPRPRPQLHNSYNELQHSSSVMTVDSTGQALLKKSPSHDPSQVVYPPGNLEPSATTNSTTLFPSASELLRSPSLAASSTIGTIQPIGSVGGLERLSQFSDIAASQLDMQKSDSEAPSSAPLTRRRSKRHGLA